MLLSTKSTNFRIYVTFSLLMKCLCGPDEVASRAGFGRRAFVWDPCSTKNKRHLALLWCNAIGKSAQNW